MSIGPKDILRATVLKEKEQQNMDIAIQMVLPKALYDKMREGHTFNDSTIRKELYLPIRGQDHRLQAPQLSQDNQLGATVPDCMQGRWHQPKPRQFGGVIRGDMEMGQLKKDSIPRKPKIYTKKKYTVPMKGSQGDSRP
jgi:hypothetical protein